MVDCAGPYPVGEMAHTGKFWGICGWLLVAVLCCVLPLACLLHFAGCRRCVLAVPVAKRSERQSAPLRLIPASPAVVRPPAAAPAEAVPKIVRKRPLVAASASFCRRAVRVG